MDKAIIRLYKYLEHKNIPPTRFEKEIGLSNGYLKKQFNRKAGLGEEVILKIIENCLDLNAEWLIFEKGEMLAKKEVTLSSTTKNKESGSEYFLQIIKENVDKLSTKDSKIRELEKEIAELKAKVNEELKKQGYDPLD